MKRIAALANWAILDLAQHLYRRGSMLNERYLHHAFSHRLQTRGDLLGLTDGPQAPLLHPEWPTCKATTGSGTALRRMGSGWRGCRRATPWAHRIDTYTPMCILVGGGV